MRSAPIDSSRRWPVAAAALVLYAIVFALSVTVEVPGGGFVALYVLPVAIIAVQFGQRAGAVAGLLALALFVVGTQVKGAEISVVSFVLRGLVFFSVGLLTGAMAQRLRAAVRANQASANHFELSRDLLCTASFDGYFKQLNGAWGLPRLDARRSCSARRSSSSCTRTTASARSPRSPATSRAAGRAASRTAMRRGTAAGAGSSGPPDSTPRRN